MIEIVKDLAATIPPSKRGRKHDGNSLMNLIDWASMEIGDGVTLGKEVHETIRQYATRAGRIHKMRFSTRKTGDKVHVIRVA